MDTYKNFINKPISSRGDLENLCEKLNIPVHVDWAENYEPDNGAYILNIGDTSGTHWVAISDDGHYFDSFGMAPDSDVPGWEELQWMPLQIQDITEGFCGQYAVLFLWFAQRNRLDEFYQLFKNK